MDLNPFERIIFTPQILNDKMTQIIYSLKTNIFTASICLLVIAVVLSSCREDKVPYPLDKLAQSERAMASTAHPLASDAGIRMIRLGGNAIDAAVAIHFALAVVYPRAGNIGGGGFMIIRMADSLTEALDFREVAPGAAHRDMYLDSLGNVRPQISREGAFSVGIPGSVKGLYTAHRRYGTLPWATLLQPAIELAEKGFRIDAREARRFNTTREQFIKYNGTDIPFVRSKAWKSGDLLLQQSLANTLKRIAQQGADGFYKGKTAAYIIETMQEHHGIVTLQDLEQYRAVWRKPIQTDYRGYTIYSMPPASSGGITLAQILKIIEPYELGKMPFHKWQHIHLMAEAEKLAYADRAEHLGDMDFYPVPIDSLLAENYLAAQASKISMDTARASDSIYAKSFYQDLESYETTHFSVVDTSGNAVSLTTTLNLNFGSKVFVKGAGFLLNDEMDDFSAKPGVPNYFGLIGNQANAIQPYKRMLSSMTPTIVEKDKELFLVVGTPGGSTIITTVAQIIINIIDFNMTLEEAVAAPRFHHQWLPEQITIEQDGFDSLTLQQLKSMGHAINTTQRIGLVDAVMQRGGMLIGVADRRGGDDVEGY